MTGLVLPQPGVLALGTSAQTYLELDLGDQPEADDLVTAIAEISGGAMTGQGCNVVVGFRPDLWRRLRPDDVPEGVHGFDEPVTGPDGFTMPATQHDLLVWVAAAGRDVVFDEATLADETTGWTYHHHLDLTGFVDGTENPVLGAAAELVLVGSGPGTGGSVLLLQRWDHDALSWEALGDDGQARVMGRTKDTDEELADKSPTSHIARSDQDEIGRILRRNIPYGDLREHGTLFVGLSSRQQILHEMLRRMVGADGGGRDDLTRYTTPVTGAYYFLPAATDLPTPEQDA
jgi:porphyrinogen peroxidase